MRRSVLASLVAAGILSAASPAQADTVVGGANPEWVRTAQTVAAAQFPNSPCAGKYMVYTNHAFSSEQERYAGIFMTGSCSFYVKKLYDPYQFCRVYVHEYGHGAMFGTTMDHESEAGAGVMTSRYVEGGYKPCEDAVDTMLYGKPRKMVLRFSRAAAKKALRKKYGRAKFTCDALDEAEEGKPARRSYLCFSKKRDVTVEWDEFLHKVIVRED